MANGRRKKLSHTHAVYVLHRAYQGTEDSTVYLVYQEKLERLVLQENQDPEERLDHESVDFNPLFTVLLTLFTPGCRWGARIGRSPWGTRRERK